MNHSGRRCRGDNGNDKARPLAGAQAGKPAAQAEAIGPPQLALFAEVEQ